jgi:Haem-binding domain
MKTLLKSTLVRWILALIVAGLAVTVIALLFETNPPVTGQPAWDSPQTLALAQRACFDCHSNETVWPWYDKLPVSSWIAVFDTLRGRRELNLSQWSAGGRSRDVSEVIQRGSMPPALYTLMHPTAILTDQEKQQLIQGLQNSLK